MLAAYWAALTLVPVPGHGPGDFSPAGNLASYVDRLVLGAHMANAVYYAEGLLSSIPAAATAILGVLAGVWLRSENPPPAKAAGLAAAGACGAAVCLSWGRWFPINKHLYTSSYAVFATGAAAALLAFLYWLVDVRGRRRWSRPFEEFGMHAPLAFCGSSLGEALLDWATLPMPDGTPGTMRLALRAHLFSWLSPPQASLAWALSWTAFWFAVVKAASLARAQVAARRATA
jgi:predicted acyltransferase